MKRKPKNWITTCIQCPHPKETDSQIKPENSNTDKKGAELRAN